MEHDKNQHKRFFISFHLSCCPNNWIASSFFCVKAHFVAHITLCGPGACVFKVKRKTSKTLQQDFWLLFRKMGENRACLLSHKVRLPSLNLLSHCTVQENRFTSSKHLCYITIVTFTVHLFKYMRGLLLTASNLSWGRNIPKTTQTSRKLEKLKTQQWHRNNVINNVMPDDDTDWFKTTIINKVAATHGFSWKTMKPRAPRVQLKLHTFRASLQCKCAAVRAGPA